MICKPCAAGDHCGDPGDATPQCTCQHYPSVRATVPRESPPAAVSGPLSPPPAPVDPPAAVPSLKARLAAQAAKINARGGGRS